uniref:Uncharacterized protein n=1 Tax=Pristionchus pacificus TaxID=54126 RepID=A0A2A6CW61_PRIPA|eukprot:PDM82368.1 hypothetical protein PRIPAC_36761 [Pristionchus pacificus]
MVLEGEVDEREINEPVDAGALEVGHLSVDRNTIGNLIVAETSEEMYDFALGKFGFNVLTSEMGLRKTEKFLTIIQLVDGRMHGQDFLLDVGGVESGNHGRHDDDVTKSDSITR